MAENPFDFFKQAMKQFDPDKGFNPAEYGAFGWPMTPFPPTGMGSSPLSPEAGTKHAVTQLFTAIETFAEESSGSQPLEIWQQYAEQLGAGELTQAEASKQVGGMVIGSYQVWLYSLAQLLVESYTLRLLHDRLINEEHRNQLGTQEWLWELAQSDREEFLRRCTDVDSDLVDEMAEVRTQRNELFYSLGRWDRVTQDDPVGDARRTLHVLKRLDALVSDDEGYNFFPGRHENGEGSKSGNDKTQTAGETDGSDGDDSEQANNPD